MKKVIILLLCICAFIACMVIGLMSGDFRVGPEPSNNPNNLAKASVTPQYHNQQNLILIQVDNLAVSKPRLEAVWLMLFKPDLPQITLLLLYPSPKDPYGQLASQFNTSPAGELDPAFNKALISFGFSYQGFILLDEAGFVQWIDWLGGININGNSYTGAQALNDMPKPWQDLGEALTQQRLAATAICIRLGQLPLDVNWFPLLNRLIPDHMQTNLTLPETVSIWNQMETSLSHFNCKTLTP